jgi:aspartyl/asparaginyl beta-hydroxylase (cupin superfamily)
MTRRVTDETNEQSADRAAAKGDFAAARAILEQAVEADQSSHGLWMKLSAMRKASGDLNGALAAVDRSLAIAPLDFSALLYRAVLLDALKDPGAGEAFGHALAQAPPDGQVPEPMKPVVAHARGRWQAHQSAFEQQLRSAVQPGLSTLHSDRVERFITNASHRTRHFPQQPTHFHYPGVPEMEVHPREQFPGLDALESATGAIRAEFDALISAEAAEMVPYIQYPERVPLGQWRELNRSPKWTAIHLLQNGQRVETNARHCPVTMEAIARLPQPDIPGASPNAMFSLLAPKTRIPPHTGVANVRLVCHLPLIVPANCGFRCGETRLEWTVGKAFVFDDTIEHEAWNDSDELRVVLIVDLWAPALSRDERHAVAAVIAASGIDLAGTA